MRSIVTVTAPRDEASLVTLEALKAELQITATETDEYLSGLLVRASEGIEAYCNRIFAVETVSEAFRLRGALDILLLRRWPVIEVDSVTVDDVALDADEFEVDPETGHLYRLSGELRVAWTPARIVVAYSAGFEAIPGPVQQALFELVKLGQASRTRDPSLRSENILEGLYSYTLFAQTDQVGSMPPQVAALLDFYAIPAV